MPIFISPSLLPRNGNNYFLVEDAYIKGGFRALSLLSQLSEVFGPSRVAYNNRSSKMFLLGQGETRLRLNSKSFETSAYIRDFVAASTAFAYVFSQPVTVLPNLDGSIFRAATTAPTTTVFALRKNGQAIGTLTFAANSQVGLCACSHQTFQRGDVLDFVTPGVIDAEFGGLTLFLYGMY